MLRAVLVDFDGTLVHTSLANSAAYATALAEVGISVDADRIAPVIEGRSWRDFLPELIGTRADVVAEAVAQRKRALYPQFYSLIRLNSQLVDLLAAVRGRLAVGLVTTASAAAVEGVTGLFQLGHLFDVVVCGDDVAQAKPHPEAYHLAAARLSVSPDECLVVEDSPVGMAAARAFGSGLLQWEPPRKDL